MVKRTGPTNVHLRKLIAFLEKASKENEAPIWGRVAELLSKPTRQRVHINLKQIDRIVNEGDVIVVPGKVLGYGELKKKITIAAWRYSESAKRKILENGSKIISIEDLVKENPKGSGVRIIV